jgi:hypothetical protein
MLPPPGRIRWWFGWSWWQMKGPRPKHHHVSSTRPCSLQIAG